MGWNTFSKDINEDLIMQTADSINVPIRNVIHYINNNFTNKIPLDLLCELFYISKYHLFHIFKEAMGLTRFAPIRRL